MSKIIEVGPAILIHGDCREIIPQIDQDVSPIGAVLTDPPYGVEYTGGHFHSGDVNIKRERKAIANDDRDVFDWAIPLILDHCPGPCYTFFADSLAGNLYRAIDQSKADIHALLIWHKINGTYAAMNAQYKQRHEPILYFKRRGGHTRWAGSSTESTILNFPREPQNIFHPAQKPIGLLSHLIENHDQALIWLDPFMGSGSTVVAALRAGRSAIGIESDREHFETAVMRAESEYSQGKLF